MDQVRGLLPAGGNLNLCLTCGACSAGCPATGLEGMVPLWKIPQIVGADWNRDLKIKFTVQDP